MGLEGVRAAGLSPRLLARVSGRTQHPPPLCSCRPLSPRSASSPPPAAPSPAESSFWPPSPRPPGGPGSSPQLWWHGGGYRGASVWWRHGGWHPWPPPEASAGLSAHRVRRYWSIALGWPGRGRKEGVHAGGARQDRGMYRHVSKARAPLLAPPLCYGSALTNSLRHLPLPLILQL